MKKWEPRRGGGMRERSVLSCPVSCELFSEQAAPLALSRQFGKQSERVVGCCFAAVRPNERSWPRRVFLSLLLFLAVSPAHPRSSSLNPPQPLRSPPRCPLTRQCRKPGLGRVLNRKTERLPPRSSFLFSPREWAFPISLHPSRYPSSNRPP